MMNVTSKDGTPIAYERSGDGPPLVLVHGTTADHTRWRPVLPALEQRRTVFAVDRRGRGESGETEPYAIEREVEDVATVVDSIGGPVDLLGHSYGALCSLEAALLTDRLRKLILYEPPIPTGIEIYPRAVIESMQELLAKDQREAALECFFREVVRMPAHQLEVLRSMPVWAARVAAAHTVLREMQSPETYIFQPERFRQMRTPTLLLLGGDSPAFLAAAITDALARALPVCRIAVMPGQQHVAMDTAPELFIKEVLDFLDSEQQG